jgi:hypothetical protein
MSTDLTIAQEFDIVKEQLKGDPDVPLTAAEDAEKVFNCHKRLKNVLERQSNDRRSTAADRKAAEGMLASLEQWLPSAEQLINAHGHWQRIEKDVNYQDSQFDLHFHADQAHDQWQATEHDGHHEDLRTARKKAFQLARYTYEARAERERTTTEEAYRAFQRAQDNYIAVCFAVEVADNESATLPIDQNSVLSKSNALSGNTSTKASSSGSSALTGKTDTDGTHTRTGSTSVNDFPVPTLGP